MTNELSKLCIITPVSADMADYLPHPDQGLPEEQPGSGGGGEEEGFPPRPTHPIYYPDAHPDQGLPGEQPHPDQGLPGEQPYPDAGLPPFPSHPIVLPPAGGGEVPELPEGLDKFDMKVGWTAETGWVVVFVPNEGTLVPTPSKGRRES
jgi:hypothetical protein